MAKQEPEVTTVTMKDGRVVDFAGKRKILKESTLVDGRIQTRLDFVNGEVLTFTINDDLLGRFAAHGAEQKLGDAAAGCESVEDAVESVAELIEQLKRGEWNAKREKSGNAGASVLVKALMEMTGKSQDDIRAFLSTKTQAEKMALRASPRVKPIVDRLEAEKARKGSAVDTDALLAGLEG